MTPLDRFLRSWRLRAGARHIPTGARVLDIGCGGGELFQLLGDRLGEGVGIDPLLQAPVRGPRYTLQPGRIPDRLPPMAPVDAIAMLAVLEHVPEPLIPATAARCFELLKPGGRLIITVPSPLADAILHLLIRIRLLDGVCAHEHHGFDPARTPGLFAPCGLRPRLAARFQLGVNCLFVLERPASAGSDVASPGHPLPAAAPRT